MADKGFKVIRGQRAAPVDVFIRYLGEEYHKAFTRIGQRQMLLRGPIIASWQGEKPTFGTNIIKAPPKYEFRIILQGGWSLGNKKWLWLNDGTKVRYAAMTQEFSPKTRVGSLRSGPGIGGLDYVNPNNPRPGIDARGWDEAIMKLTADAVGQDLATALNNALNRALGFV